MTEIATAEGIERILPMIPLVRLLARRVYAGLPAGSGIEVSDLIQAGNLGLIQAVRTFQESHGARLPGYAKYRIRGEMLDTVRRHTGRGNARWRMQCFSGEDGNGIEDFAPAPGEGSPHRQLATLQRAAILEEEVGRLPVRYRLVLRLRYSGGLNLKEIGAALRVNESRACQIHRSAISRLRQALGQRGVNALWHLL
jgi:RNA polymerase sigma factor for flagellar operon FliA